MTDVGTAALQIIPSFQGFQGKLESGSSGAMVAAGSSGGKKFGDSAGRSLASSFSRHAKTAALAAGAGLAAAGAIAFKIGKDSIAEAIEAQKVGALTASTIKATGDAANVTAKQVADLAGAISLKTGIDDETIQSGENMLLTFKNIRNEAGAGNDIFNQTTKTLVDLSAAMGSEPKQAAIQLGKALNDPIKGVTALSRVGVTFTDQQKEQIKTLVESGKTMDAQKIVLKELNSEFGGAAAAQATMGDKVKTAWGNIEEQLGTALLPMLEDVEHWFLKKGVPAITGWIDTFQHKGIPAIKDFVEQAKPVAEDVLPKLGHVLGTVRDVLADAAPYAKDLVDAFINMPDWAQKAIVGGGLAVGVGSKLGVGSLLTGGKGGGGGILGAFSKASPMPVYVVNGGGFDLPGTPGAPGEKPKTSAARNIARVAVPVAVADAAYETAFGDVYGLVPKSKPSTMAQQQGAFGSGLTRPIDQQRAAEAALSAANVAAQTDAANEHIRSMMASLETLPDEVITNIALNGAPESKKEAMELVKQYDLTPKQKKTLFETYGIYENKRVAKMYQDLLGETPKEKRTKFGVDGIPKAKSDVVGLTKQLANAAAPRQGSIGINTSQAEANLSRVLNYLNNINRMAAMNAERGIDATPSASGGGGGGGQGLAAGGGGGGGWRPGTRIDVHLDGEKMGSWVDNRVASRQDLVDEKRRAGWR